MLLTMFNQMPIVDGLTSTKMIRSYEKSHATDILSVRAALNSRVPIFAVSASLMEKDFQKYVDAGFDGWILKPVDFKRLGELLCGIVEEDTRRKALYVPGNWDEGGWFTKLQPDLFNASTKPSPQESVSSAPLPAQPGHGDDDPISKEQDRLDQLETDAVHASSQPSDRGQSGNLKHAGLESLANEE